MAATVTVNGIDLSSLGVYVAFAPNHRTTATRQIGRAPVLGRDGGVDTGSLVVGPRRFSLTGTIDPSARTVAALASATDLCNDLFWSGRLSIIYTDTAGNTLLVEADTLRVSIAPRLNKEHFQAATVADLTVDLEQASPTQRSVEPTLLALPTANARYSVALGTAPSRYKFRAMGASPALTYRTAGGDTVWTVTLTKSITANEDWFDFDATTGRIWYSDNGVVSDAIAAGYLTGGNQDWPKGLDPQDGDYRTSQWPTVSCNVAAELLYWKEWL